ncbi:MAG: hypothetical protein ACKVWR_12050 [Acidimicrobiales bacterium]
MRTFPPRRRLEPSLDRGVEPAPHAAVAALEGFFGGDSSAPPGEEPWYETDLARWAALVAAALLAVLLVVLAMWWGDRSTTTEVSQEAEQRPFVEVQPRRPVRAGEVTVTVRGRGCADESAVAITVTPLRTAEHTDPRVLARAASTAQGAAGEWAQQVSLRDPPIGSYLVRSQCRAPYDVVQAKADAETAAGAEEADAGQQLILARAAQAPTPDTLSASTLLVVEGSARLAPLTVTPRRAAPGQALALEVGGAGCSGGPAPTPAGGVGLVTGAVFAVDGDGSLGQTLSFNTTSASDGRWTAVVPIPPGAARDAMTVYARCNSARFDYLDAVVEFPGGTGTSGAPVTLPPSSRAPGARLPSAPPAAPVPGEPRYAG